MGRAREESTEGGNRGKPGKIIKLMGGDRNGAGDGDGGDTLTRRNAGWTKKREAETGPAIINQLKVGTGLGNAKQSSKNKSAGIGHDGAIRRYRAFSSDRPRLHPHDVLFCQLLEPVHPRSRCIWEVAIMMR